MSGSSLPPICTPRSRGSSIHEEEDNGIHRPRGSSSFHDTSSSSITNSSIISTSSSSNSSSSTTDAPFAAAAIPLHLNFNAWTNKSTSSAADSNNDVSVAKKGGGGDICSNFSTWSSAASVDELLRKDHNRHLFSRDFFIEFIKDELFSAFFKENRQASYKQKCIYIEELVEEHIRTPRISKLSGFVPSIGVFHTPLHITEAFDHLDKKYNISRRMHIPPSFTEIKDMLNLSQTWAVGSRLGLATFDGDGTLYDDGENFGKYPKIGEYIVKLLRSGVFISVVTAAGYGLDGSKYEVRLRGLIDMFVAAGLSDEEASRFYVCGGQCNYLLQCKYVVDELDVASKKHIAKLIPVPYDVWQKESLGGPRPYYWPSSDIERILNLAEAILKDAINPESEDRLFNADEDLITIIRKERTVGIFSKEPIRLRRDPLNEICFRIKVAMEKLEPKPSIPYCVFNGGHDAWTDIGNKAVGIAALQKYLNVTSNHTIHFGDQLLRQGNDIAARAVAATIWVSNPIETNLNLARIWEKFN